MTMHQLNVTWHRYALFALKSRKPIKRLIPRVRPTLKHFSQFHLGGRISFWIHREVQRPEILKFAKQ